MPLREDQVVGSAGLGRLPVAAQVASDEDRLYFAPESGGLKLSPMDEDAMEPCDAHPDDLVIAEGFERLRRLAPALVPRSIRRKWSGLRTFTPDRVLETLKA